MDFIGVLLSVGISLFFWMYLMTYFMHIGAQRDFFMRARSAVLRGMGVAGLLLLIHHFFPFFFWQFQWLLIPGIFFLSALPFVWTRWRYASLMPLGIVMVIYGSLFFGLHNTTLIDIGETPLYEEIGKWFQSMTYAYPAVMSPFVALGFGFLENLAYFSTEFTWSQFFGRTLFSLPMHMFVGFFGLWCLFRIRPIWLGALVGCGAAIILHILYNWSLGFSLLITLVIMVGGYLFYGWSLENAWWKKLTDKIS